MQPGPRNRASRLTSANNKTTRTMDPKTIYQEFCERRDFYRSFGFDREEMYRQLIDSAGLYDGTVLEIGTGKGYCTLALAEHGLTVISIDIAEEDQRRAEALLRYFDLADDVEFRIMDATALAFEDESFDIVLSVYALHHMQEAKRCLKEMMRVIRPQGKIVVSDFNDHGFGIVDTIHKARGQAGHSTGGLRLEEARHFFEDAGYRVRFYSHDLNDIIIAEKI